MSSFESLVKYYKDLIEEYLKIINNSRKAYCTSTKELTGLFDQFKALRESCDSMINIVETLGKNNYGESKMVTNYVDSISAEDYPEFRRNFAMWVLAYVKYFKGYHAEICLKYDANPSGCLVFLAQRALELYVGYLTNTLEFVSEDAKVSYDVLVEEYTKIKEEQPWRLRSTSRRFRRYLKYVLSAPQHDSNNARYLEAVKRMEHLVKSMGLALEKIQLHYGELCNKLTEDFRKEIQQLSFESVDDEENVCKLWLIKFKKLAQAVLDRCDKTGCYKSIDELLAEIRRYTYSSKYFKNLLNKYKDTLKATFDALENGTEECDECTNTGCHLKSHNDATALVVIHTSTHKIVIKAECECGCGKTAVLNEIPISRVGGKTYKNLHYRNIKELWENSNTSLNLPESLNAEEKTLFNEAGLNMLPVPMICHGYSLVYSIMNGEVREELITDPLSLFIHNKTKHYERSEQLNLMSIGLFRKHLDTGRGADKHTPTAEAYAQLKRDADASYAEGKMDYLDYLYIQNVNKMNEHRQSIDLNSHSVY